MDNNPIERTVARRSLKTLNRESLKDAGVYLLLLLTFLAVSASCAHFMYGRSSDGLFRIFGAPWNQMGAKIVVARQIGEILKASGRDLGALTDEQRRELDKAKLDVVKETETETVNWVGQLPSRCLISLRQGVYTAVPSFFLIGFLGVLVGRYRRLFIVPLLAAGTWASVFVTFLLFRTSSGTSVWYQFIPELTLSLGKWLMAATIALLVGCFSGRATLRAFRRVSSSFPACLVFSRRNAADSALS